MRHKICQELKRLINHIGEMSAGAYKPPSQRQRKHTETAKKTGIPVQFPANTHSALRLWLACMHVNAIACEICTQPFVLLCVLGDEMCITRQIDFVICNCFIFLSFSRVNDTECEHAGAHMPNEWWMPTSGREGIRRATKWSVQSCGFSPFHIA